MGIDLMEIDLLDTEFIDDDGDVSEIEYEESETINRILKWQQELNWKSVMILIGSLTEMTKSAVSNTRKSAPAGLTDKSILTRMNRKQYAYSFAIDKMIKEKDKKLYRRLFRDNEPLWNYMMRCSIIAIDEILSNDTNGIMTKEIQK